MKKQTQAIHLEYERRDAYDSLSVPVYNTLAYEFDNAAVMAEAFFYTRNKVFLRKCLNTSKLLLKLLIHYLQTLRLEK